MNLEQPPKPKIVENEQLKGIVICAWCKKEIGRWEGPGISHGLCQECKVGVNEEIESLKEEKEKN